MMRDDDEEEVMMRIRLRIKHRYPTSRKGVRLIVAGARVGLKRIFQGSSGS